MTDYVPSFTAKGMGNFISNFRPNLSACANLQARLESPRRSHINILAYGAYCRVLAYAIVVLD